jgi:hypothetical protein
MVLGSGKKLFRIPDQGQKAPDPGSGSATLGRGGADGECHAVKLAYI